MKSAEILIIGGGVIGLSIARELHKRGRRSIHVLDKGEVGHEASWAAAGILAPQVEADVDDEFFRLCYESNKIYSPFAAELLDETGVDIELDRRGVIFVGFDEQDTTEFERRFKWQSAAGLNIEMIDSHDLAKLQPNLSAQIRDALYFADHGQVENRKLVDALIQYVERNEITFSSGTEVFAIEKAGLEMVSVETSSGRFEADTAIVAAGAWTSQIDLSAVGFSPEVKPVKGQMICYGRSAPAFRHVIYSRRGYLVPRADGRLLAGATVEDIGFDKSVTAAGVARLKTVAEEIAPSLANIDLADRWSGLRPYTAGGRPLIGPVPDAPGLFIATGHFRNGILLAPITAKIIADAIEQKKHRFLEHFGAKSRSGTAV